MYVETIWGEPVGNIDFDKPMRKLLNLILTC